MPVSLLSLHGLQQGASQTCVGLGPSGLHPLLLYPRYSSTSDLLHHLHSLPYNMPFIFALSTAWAAARRATGTR